MLITFHAWLQHGDSTVAGQARAAPYLHTLCAEGALFCNAGSRHHGLDSHYQQWLNSLQSYQPPGTLTATIGSVASGAVLLSAAYTAVPAYVLSRVTSSNGSSSREAGASRQEVQQAAVATAAASGGQTADAAAAGGSVAGSNGDSRPPSDFVSYLRWYTGSSQKLVWDVHDSLAPWLGSGSSAKNRK